MRKYYYIYKITCLCGNLKDHYYYGQHRTDNLNDGYAGSGNILLYYYKKYGKIENKTYKKEIIEFANSSDDLNDLEFKLIGNKYKDDPLCINLRCGGYCSCGDYNNFYGKHHSEKTKKIISEKRKGNQAFKGKHHSVETKKIISENTKIGMRKEESWNKYIKSIELRVGKHLTNEHKKKISESLKINGHPNGMLGKHHTEEAKKKIGENNHGLRFTGHKHSEETKRKMSEKRKGKKTKMNNRGRKWYHLNNINKVIKQEDILYYESIGYIPGRNRLIN